MRLRRRQVGVMLAMFALAVAVCSAPAAAKRKAKGGGVVDITKPLNVLVPERGAGTAAPYSLVTSTIDVVGKRFKAQRVRDVNVTVQTTGVTGDFPGAALEAVLTAPNGASSRIFFGLSGGGATPSIGPLTLDDEAPLQLGIFFPVDPTRLYQPWAGSAQPQGKKLAVMDNGPATGAWTLRMLGTITGQSSLFNFWRLQVTTGKPYRTR